MAQTEKNLLLTRLYIAEHCHFPKLFEVLETLFAYHDKQEEYFKKFGYNEVKDKEAVKMKKELRKIKKFLVEVANLYRKYKLYEGIEPEE